MLSTAAQALNPMYLINEESGVIYREAELKDNDTIQSILRENSMDSWVRISTEHEPCYFDSCDLFGETYTIIAEQVCDPRSAVGICSSVVMPVHINGKEVRVAYLGNLRVAPAFRNKMGVLRAGFKSIRTLAENKKTLQCWFTSIAKENTVARRVLEANLKGMPVYRPQGELLTIALSVRLGKGINKTKNSNILQPAREQDIPALVQFYNQQAAAYQYSPVLSEQWLTDLNGENGLNLSDFWLIKEQGVIRACFALWDQRKIKQTVVRGYRIPLNIFRPLFNMYARISGRVSLPASGEKIDYIFISFLAIDDIARTETEMIVRAALSLIKDQGAKNAMLGLSTKSPLLPSLGNLPTQTYYTCIESVTWPGQEEIPIDPMPIQPEIAIL